MEKLHIFSIAFGLFFHSLNAFSQEEQSEIAAFKKYDFASGEKVLFDDQSTNEKSGQSPQQWKVEGGRAVIEQKDSVSFISIKEYYTKLTPVLKNTKVIPNNFTIEYDTWLADGYDGNPGIEILFTDLKENWLNITPNKHSISVDYPQNGHASTDNPEEFFGENKFYNRWVHISISYNQKKLVVYMDQYKQIDIADCRIIPSKITVTGNTSQEMPILLKNFRIATGIPASNLTLENGKFVTHAIKFDVNKAILKPESMAILNKLTAYMTSNPTIRFQINGHTDSDGSDDFNMKLSEKRAEAVREQLITMGIDANRLIVKGFGETNPMTENTSFEGKAMNRRVEFVSI